MLSLTKFKRIHQNATDTQRLGQRFCNFYLKDATSVPNLFYAADDQALKLIEKWLADHHYETELPPVLKMPERLAADPGTYIHLR